MISLIAYIAGGITIAKFFNEKAVLYTLIAMTLYMAIFTLIPVVSFLFKPSFITLSYHGVPLTAIDVVRRNVFDLPLIIALGLCGVWVGKKLPFHKRERSDRL